MYVVFAQILALLASVATYSQNNRWDNSSKNDKVYDIKLFINATIGYK